MAVCWPRDAGAEADPTEARLWIARAAGSGMIDAEVALAEMSLNGVGGTRDHAEALVLFRRAADRGHVGAMFAVGAMLGGGHEVPEDRRSRPGAGTGWRRIAATAMPR